jgi:hypothetical protein
LPAAGTILLQSDRIEEPEARILAGWYVPPVDDDLPRPSEPSPLNSGQRKPAWGRGSERINP